MRRRGCGPLRRSRVLSGAEQAQRLFTSDLLGEINIKSFYVNLQPTAPPYVNGAVRKSGRPALKSHTSVAARPNSDVSNEADASFTCGS